MEYAKGDTKPPGMIITCFRGGECSVYIGGENNQNKYTHPPTVGISRTGSLSVTSCLRPKKNTEYLHETTRHDLTRTKQRQCAQSSAYKPGKAELVLCSDPGVKNHGAQRCRTKFPYRRVHEPGDKPTNHHAAVGPIVAGPIALFFS